jgi:hypothetical protein
MLRQGDLWFETATTVPVEAVKVEDGVIARGEATGHTHRIRDQQCAILLAYAGSLYVKARQETHIDHEEHKTITLPPGDWQVTRQREYTPEGWRTVAD